VGSTGQGQPKPVTDGFIAHLDRPAGSTGRPVQPAGRNRPAGLPVGSTGQGKNRKNLTKITNLGVVFEHEVCPGTGICVLFVVENDELAVSIFCEKSDWH